MKLDVKGLGVVKPAKVVSTSKFRKLTGKESYPNIEEGVIGVSRNIRVLGDIIRFSSVQIAAQAAIAVLRASQLRVPHDTGELKESGRARMRLGSYALDIGWGNDEYGSDAVRTDLDKISRARVEGKKRIDINVQYAREGNTGEDVALIAHEDISPYGGDSPAAKKPGTGPKYLEIPFNMLKGRYVKELRSSINRLDRDIKSISEIQRKAKTKWEVDTIRLNESKAFRKWVSKKYGW